MLFLSIVSHNPALNSFHTTHQICRDEWWGLSKNMSLKILEIIVNLLTFRLLGGCVNGGVLDIAASHLTLQFLLHQRHF